MQSYKKIFMFILVFGFIFTTSIAKANIDDLTNCDYDSLYYGFGTLKDDGVTYELDMSDESGEGYLFKGSVNDIFYKQTKAALEATKPNEYGMKEIILLTSLDEPVCATTATQESLYLQKGMIEKPDYYVVSVCLPETSHCWKLKINKKSPLAMDVKNRSLPEEGKICVITYTPDKSILGLYEDENAEY